MTIKMDAVSSRRFFPAIPVLGILGLALGATHCASEPQNVCAVPTGEAIALFTPKTMMPTGPGCTNAMTFVSPALSGATPFGEAFGIEWYVGLNPNDPNAPNVPGSFAIKSEALGGRIAGAVANAGQMGTMLPATFQYYPYPDAAHIENPPPEDTTENHPYAWGKFDSVYPDANGICTVSHMIGSHMVYTDVPPYMDMTSMMMTTDQPQTDIDYEWSNVKILVQGAVIGAQMSADLTITEDMCSQQYHVSILFPRVTCNALDANMNITGPDNSACSANPTPVPNPKQSQVYGSGIAPGLDVSCQNIGTMMAPDYECLPTHSL
jgi:hypothetical protein